MKKNCIIHNHTHNRLGAIMSEAEKLTIYLEKLKALSLENLQEDNTTAIHALKKALSYIEGEMIGY